MAKQASAQQREKMDQEAKRIEAWAEKHVAKGLTPLPRDMSNPYDLIPTVLHTIADWLDRATEAPADKAASANKKDAK